MSLHDYTFSRVIPCSWCGKIRATISPITSFYPVCSSCLDQHIEDLERDHREAIEKYIALEVHLDQKDA